MDERELRAAQARECAFGLVFWGALALIVRPYAELVVWLAGVFGFAG